MPLAVVAFGGNALLRPEDHGTQEEQIARAKQAARWLAEIVRLGYKLIVVHGNGPQVGNILIQAEEASTKIPPQSLDVCVAQTEGSIGFMLQQSIRNRLESIGLAASTSGEVATILTEVEVDVNDPAGGGGIPVVKGRDGQWRGIEAVIDKDYASARLAADLDADLFIILTGVPKVALDFGKPSQRFVERMTVAEAEQHLADGQFPAGSMGPKIDSALQFVRATGKQVLITDVDVLREALQGKDGTLIVA